MLKRFFKRMFRTEAPVTVTLKGGPTPDAPWVVIKGDSPKEAFELLCNRYTQRLLSFEVETANELFQR